MKRLLIIEDETPIRENYCELFEEEGYIVSGASSGKEGIELAVSACPDLIICDIGMPGLDGFEVKDILSKDKSTSSIPFIYLTARTDIRDVQRGLELGADDFIIKPVSTDKLLDLVSNRLQRIEESTRQSEARLKRAELISKCGSWEMHMESMITILSQGANKIFGIYNYSVDSETIKDLILPEYRMQIQNGFKLLVENNLPYNAEYKIKAADTGEIKVIHSVAEYDKDRKVILGAIQDITERKLSEEKIRKYSKELEESYEAKHKIFTIIAHDLRCPFSPVLGLTQTIMNEFDSLSKEELKLYNTEIFNAMKSAHTLLENLLNWSKLETGLITLNPSKLNFFNITEEAINLSMANARLKDILIINMVEKNLYVSGDSNMVHSILHNLISNAIKFTIKNGKVKISSERAENNFVRITVSDNGVGMAEEQIKNLFSVAAKSTRGTNDERGTGLGLMICKEMIERHGGTILVKSEYGRGTDVVFTLPELAE